MLDSSPLGALANPNDSELSLAIQTWLHTRIANDDIANDDIVVIPEISDYEVRRELLRAGLNDSVSELDFLRTFLDVIPIDGKQLQEAAALWAQAWQKGRPAAPDPAIDGDMILVAQARAASAIYGNTKNIMIATTNTKHLDLFADAREWQKIK